MARPIKENLDYFPFDTDFFSDTKIKILKAKYGADGIAIYLYIVCEIYRDKGYYTEYNEDFVLVMSDYFNFSELKTKQILEYLFSRSLLVKSKLSESVTVITAKSVQRRYQDAKKASIKKVNGVCDREVVVDERIWLLKKEETKSPIKVQPFDSFRKENDNFRKENPNKPEKNAQSKVKESKVKERKGKCGKFQIPCRNGVFEVDEEYYTHLTQSFPNMNVDESLKKLTAFMESNPEKQRCLNNVKGSIEWWLNGDNQAGKYRKNAVSNIPTADDYNEEW